MPLFNLFNNDYEQDIPPEKMVDLKFLKYGCDFRTRGTILKRGSNWEASNQLERDLINHHLNTGGGNHTHNTIAHCDVQGYDEDGNIISASISSYGITFNR